MVLIGGERTESWVRAPALSSPSRLAELIHSRLQAVARDRIYADMHFIRCTRVLVLAAAIIGVSSRFPANTMLWHLKTRSPQPRASILRMSLS